MLCTTAEQADFSGTGSIDASGTQRDQPSSHYRNRVGYLANAMKTTPLTDPESLIIKDDISRRRKLIRTYWVTSLSTRSHAQFIFDCLRQFVEYTSSLLNQLTENAQKTYQRYLILQERLATVTQPRTAEVA